MGKIVELFRNPRTRARALIWTGMWIVVGGVAFFGIVAMTSTYWFCTEVCHGAHDDNTLAYQLSTHSKVSCLACHMPAGADPVTFMLHKASALKDVVSVVAGTYEIPLNGGSHLSLNPDHMGSDICLQCHDLSKREITPSAAMIIDHKAHSDANISCTMCHNRVAHNEDPDDGYKPINIDLQTGVLNVGHPDFSAMNGCFRCHRLPEDGITAETPFDAPGGCNACHPASFDLVPSTHKDDGWKSAHGDMAKEEWAHVAEVEAELEAEAGHEAEPKGEEAKATAEVPNIGLVSECYTCHSPSYCNDCHGGLEMPHPADFGTVHADEAKTNLPACITCHGEKACDSCHHQDPNVPGWELNTSQPWLNQHNDAALKAGYTTCLECHEDPAYCESCHVRLRVRN